MGSLLLPAALFEVELSVAAALLLLWEYYFRPAELALEVLPVVKQVGERVYCNLERACKSLLSAAVLLTFLPFL